MTRSSKKERLLEAKLRLIAVAELKLGRSLTDRERGVVDGFERSLLFYESCEEFIASFEPPEVLKFLQPRGDSESTVALLETLASSSAPVMEDLESMQQQLKQKVRRIVRSFDFESESKQFNEWFLALLRDEPPPKKVRALNFGLFETQRGAALYVSGANRYSPDDSDWVLAEDWLPGNRYAPLGRLSALWSPLQQVEAEPWIVSQALVILLVRVFFAQCSAEFQNLSGLKTVHVATGFDDGDLYALRTPLMPSC